MNPKESHTCHCRFCLSRVVLIAEAPVQKQHKKCLVDDLVGWNCNYRSVVVAVVAVVFVVVAGVSSAGQLLLATTAHLVATAGKKERGRRHISVGLASCKS